MGVRARELVRGSLAATVEGTVSAAAFLVVVRRLIPGLAPASASRGADSASAVCLLCGAVSAATAPPPLGLVVGLRFYLLRRRWGLDSRFGGGGLLVAPSAPT